MKNPESPTYLSVEEFNRLNREHYERTSRKVTIEKIEKIVGKKIKNIELYKQALLHKSMQSIVGKSNERIEFLGDSVLGMVVAEYVFTRYPEKDEGFYTKLRSKLVNTNALADLSTAIGIHELIIVSRRIDEASEGKIENKKILEDAFEAFIGAIYLDLGFFETKAFILTTIEGNIDFTSIMRDNNFKDIMLRWTQKFGLALPTYSTILAGGPPHKRLFTVQAWIGQQKYGIGFGSSKRSAEQHAARRSLEMLEVDLTCTISDTV